MSNNVSPRIIDATKSQMKASAPANSVWVGASAGSGKTKVLTDRVLRLLLEGASPQKILCLTFTKAAAAQMANKVAGRLADWAVIPTIELEKKLSDLLGSMPNDETEREKLITIARQLFAVLLDTPGGMRIQTIHSFCQELLKRFPLEAGVSPHFEVIDDRTSTEIIEKSKQQALSANNASQDADLLNAIDFIINNVHENFFGDLIGKMISNRPKLKRLILKEKKLSNVEAKIKEYLGIRGDESIKDVYAKAFAPEYCDTDKIKTWANLLNDLGSAKDIEKADMLFAILDGRIKGERAFKQYYDLFFTQKGEERKTLCTKKPCEADPELYDYMKGESERIGRLKQKICALITAKASVSLLRIGFAILDEYEKVKGHKSLLDYDDLVIKTKELLKEREVADWVLYKLDGGIEHILVDEAQDTSPDSWEIIKSLSEEFFAGLGAKDANRTVFAVGDRKQSIYSFQGADPDVFDEVKNLFAKRVINAQKSWEEVPMHISFRSTKAVLDVVNAVFKQDNEASKGVVLEGEDATHIPAREQDGGVVELWPIIEAREGEEEDPYRPPVERISTDSPMERLAKIIADKIHSSIKNKELLPSKGRAIRAVDYLILLQRRGDFQDCLVKNLKKLGVNVAGVDKMVLTEQIAIMDLIALGNFLLMPEDDLNLATLLKSPIVGLSEDELFELAYNRRDSLWASLYRHNREAGAIAEAARLLGQWLNIADRIRPHELYAEILGKYGVRKKMIARLGLEAEDPINEFMNLTINYEIEHPPVLQGFLNWLQKGDVEIKRDLEQEGGDAVRIMTVHGSKGLQAPIVIMPDTLRVPRNEQISVLWDKPSNLFFWVPKSDNIDEISQSLKEKSREDVMKEYRRLLYVAMTRAEDRLYICGFGGKKGSQEGNWYQLIENAFASIAHKETNSFIASHQDEFGSDEAYVWKTEQLKKIEAPDTEQIEVSNFDLPFWALEAPDAEPTPPRPLTPSKPEDEDMPVYSPLGSDNGYRFKRGLIIHSLLQILPELAEEKRKQALADYVYKIADDMKAEAKNRIIDEVTEVLDNSDFACLFNENSKAEVAISGLVGERVVNGKIDRLIVNNDEVIIVDFKTNRPPPADAEGVSPQYKKQLALYKELIARTYPNKQVKTALLWTDIPKLMWIDV